MYDCFIQFVFNRFCLAACVILTLRFRQGISGGFVIRLCFSSARVVLSSNVYYFRLVELRQLKRGNVWFLRCLSLSYIFVSTILIYICLRVFDAKCRALSNPILIQYSFFHTSLFESGIERIFSGLVLRFSSTNDVYILHRISILNFSSSLLRRSIKSLLKSMLPRYHA